MCHQFPWLPDSCVALGLALHERLIGRGTSPSKTKDRTLIIQVSCGNCVGGKNAVLILPVLIFSPTLCILSHLRCSACTVAPPPRNFRPEYSIKTLWLRVSLI